jgi:hypothetical protein
MNESGTEVDILQLVKQLADTGADPSWIAEPLVRQQNGLAE